LNKIHHGLCALAVLIGLASAERGSAQMAAHPATHAAPATELLILPDPVQQQEEPDTTINITSVGADLQFLPDEIAAKAGTRVRIRYINEGTFPHNIVIVKNDADIDPLGAAAFQAASTDYVPLAMEDRMIAHSPLAAPGETVEFTFVVPPPGEYPFVCLYSGHYNMMLGTLRSLK
jgi:plastocyanin